MQEMNQCHLEFQDVNWTLGKGQSIRRTGLQCQWRRQHGRVEDRGPERTQRHDFERGFADLVTAKPIGFGNVQSLLHGMPVMPADDELCFCDPVVSNWLSCGSCNRQRLGTVLKDCFCDALGPGS